MPSRAALPRPLRMRGRRTGPCGDGFALPFTLFALAMISILAAAGFLLSTVEWHMGRAHSASLRAFYVADGGLQQLLGTTVDLPAATSLFVLPDGDASVTSKPLLELVPGRWLYRTTSVARVSRPVFGFAARTVAATLLATSPLDPPAALVAAGPLTAVSSAGTVAGADIADASCAGGGDRAGVLTSDASRASWEGGPLALVGAPPVRSTGPAFDVPSQTGILWHELVEPAATPPDAVHPDEPWPPAAATSAVGAPVILVRPSADPLAASDGRGVLLAAGHLTLHDGFRWRGLILVGGRLTVRGHVVVEGVVMAGLSPSLAVDGVGVDLDGATLDLRYHSCYVDAAAQRLVGPPVLVPGTWTEIF